MTVGLAGAGSGPDPSIWTPSERVTPSDAHEAGTTPTSTAHAFVHFGSSLDVDGNTLVVGTAFDSCDLGTWAYVFGRTGDGGWEQRAKLAPADGEFNDAVWEDPCSGFGRAVSVDGETGIVVVGNPGYDVPGEEDIGSAYVFERGQDGSWTEVAKLVHPGSPVGDRHAMFGFSVSVDGSTIAVGALLDDHVAPKSGSVFVFERDTDGWTQTAQMSGRGYRSFLGGDVEVARDTVAGSASLESSPAGSLSGTVHVLERNGTGWGSPTVVEPPVPSVGDGGGSFGSGLALSGDGSTLVVGAPWSDEFMGVNLEPVHRAVNTGRVYVFDRSESGWALSQEIPSPDPIPQEHFGSDVAINEEGTVLAVGSPSDVGAPFVSGTPGGTGSAYVFEAEGESWTFSAKLLGEDTSPGDTFGREVGVSGGSVAVGAPFDDNRRDGTPPPVDDEGDTPPCVMRDVVWGCDEGENAGSVWTFRPGIGMHPASPGASNLPT